MQQYLQNKKGLVEDVFNKVFDKYDLMNDLMSFGAHRVWKKDLINWMNPGNNKLLLDVACGTGDVAKLFLEKTSHNNFVHCVDPNKEMIKKCKNKLEKFKNVNFFIASAEKLPFHNNIYNYYTISFGLRNTKNLKKSLDEAYRVLKPGGRFLCLEFSKIQNLALHKIYQKYAKIIPELGKLVVGEKKPYEYLIQSIEEFVNQDELIDLMKQSKFQNCKYRNLSGGVVAIHSGWKI